MRELFVCLVGGKTAKNRVHLGVRVADRDVRGEERLQRIEEQVERLTQMGATIAWREDEMHGNGVVMRDPRATSSALRDFAVCA